MAPVRRSLRGPWLAVAAVCIGAFMGQLDASIVSLALPTLRSSFHASLAAVSWVGQAYLLVLVAMLPVVGRLADRVGRKLIYTYGFVFFALGSAACALAPDLGALVACRAAQGGVSPCSCQGVGGDFSPGFTGLRRLGLGRGGCGRFGRAFGWRAWPG